MSPLQTQPSMVCCEGIPYKGTLARNLRCSRRRRIGVDRLALTSPSVVHCQFFELFGVCQSTASKLVSLWNCSAAHELLLSDKIFSSSKADNPPPFNLRCPQNPQNNTNHKKKQPMKNIWPEKPGACAQNSTPPQQLYSATVKKNTKHDSFDVSQVMPQMSQMMTQWGQMLSIIQSKI
ncbi:hypothetical protein TNCV_1232021 [Trichonephila clavipes]|nr:hypothetical protein TNCV_1232021 [Trichonephila clavipes]